MSESCGKEGGSASHHHSPGQHHFHHIRHVSVVVALVAVVTDSSVVAVLINEAANAAVEAIVVTEAIAEAMGDASFDEKKACRDGGVDGHHDGGRNQPPVPALHHPDGQHPGDDEEGKGPDAFAK